MPMHIDVDRIYKFTGREQRFWKVGVMQYVILEELHEAGESLPVDAVLRIVSDRTGKSHSHVHTCLLKMDFRKMVHIDYDAIVHSNMIAERLAEHERA